MVITSLKKLFIEKEDIKRKKKRVKYSKENKKIKNCKKPKEAKEKLIKEKLVAK